MGFEELRVARVTAGRKRYSGCILRLDTEGLSIEVYCPSGFPFKKMARVAGFPQSPQELYRSARSGAIVHGDTRVELDRDAAERVASIALQHISSKALECASKALESLARLLTARAGILRDIQELGRRPREKILEIAGRLGEERLADPQRTPLERIPELFEEELRRLGVEAIEARPSCPEAPEGAVERVYKAAMKIVELQDSAYSGLSTEGASKIVSEVKALLGELPGEAEKELYEALSRGDLVGTTEAFIRAVRRALEGNMLGIVREELT